MQKVKFAEKLLDLECRTSHLADLVKCLTYVDFDCDTKAHRCVRGAFEAIFRLSDYINSELSELEMEYRSDNDISYGKAATINV